MTRRETPLPPSELFMECVTDGGTPSAKCGFCGMTTIGRPNDYGDVGPELYAKAESDPRRYRVDPLNDSVSVGELAGSIVVYGCPCNGARRYEDFIWSHRRMIARYLKERAAKELQEAQANAELAVSL